MEKYNWTPDVIDKLFLYDMLDLEFKKDTNQDSEPVYEYADQLPF